MVFGTQESILGAMKTLTLLCSLFYSLNASAILFKIESLKEQVSYSNGEVFTTEAMLYRPVGREAKAILYLFPTINGPSPLETTTARFFVHRGFAVVIPKPVGLELNIDDPDAAQLDKDYFKPSAAAMTLIEAADRALKKENLPVFALGASQGGIRTVGLTAESSRVKAAWFAVAGGNFPLVYATSQVEKIKTLRKNHMKKLGLDSASAYENYLRLHLKNDPTYSCAKISVPIVQVIALRDNKVPTSTQYELNEACPSHRVLEIDGSHVRGASTVYFYKEKIFKFFTDQL